MRALLDFRSVTFGVDAFTTAPASISLRIFYLLTLSANWLMLGTGVAKYPFNSQLLLPLHSARGTIGGAQ
jgi:hypothetical protein